VGFDWTNRYLEETIGAGGLQVHGHVPLRPPAEVARYLGHPHPPRRRCSRDRSHLVTSSLPSLWELLGSPGGPGKGEVTR
jgi:hypothetical protein